MSPAGQGTPAFSCVADVLGAALAVASRATRLDGSAQLHPCSDAASASPPLPFRPASVPSGGINSIGGRGILGWRQRKRLVFPGAQGRVCRRARPHSSRTERAARTRRVFHNSASFFIRGRQCTGDIESAVDSKVGIYVDGIVPARVSTLLSDFLDILPSKFFAVRKARCSAAIPLLVRCKRRHRDRGATDRLTILSSLK